MCENNNFYFSEFHKSDITCMGYSEKHKFIISGDVEGSIVLWDNKISSSQRYPNSLPSTLSLNELDKTIVKVDYPQYSNSN